MAAVGDGTVAGRGCSRTGVVVSVWLARVWPPKTVPLENPLRRVGKGLQLAQIIVPNLVRTNGTGFCAGTNRRCSPFFALPFRSSVNALQQRKQSFRTGTGDGAIVPVVVRIARWRSEKRAAVCHSETASASSSSSHTSAGWYSSKYVIGDSFPQPRGIAGQCLSGARTLMPSSQADASQAATAGVDISVAARATI